MTTIVEIAKATGYSVTTVSVVLRGDGNTQGITSKTQKKIIDQAKVMGYTPNASARRLRLGTNAKSLAVFWTDDFRATLVFRLLSGLQKYIADTGEHIDLTIKPYQPHHLHEALKPAVLSSYSYCIVCGAADEDITYLSQLNTLLPIVLYNRKSDLFSCVYVDDDAIGSRVAQALLQKKIDEIILLSSKNRPEYVQRRINGFDKVMQAHDVPYTYLESEDTSICSAYEAIQQYRWNDEKSTGLFCTSDYLMFGAIKGIRNQQLDINRVELVFVGTGDKQLYATILNRYSVIDVPIEKMGYQCLEIAEKLLGASECKNKHHQMDFIFEEYKNSNES